MSASRESALKVLELLSDYCLAAGGEDLEAAMDNDDVDMLYSSMVEVVTGMMHIAEFEVLEWDDILELAEQQFREDLLTDEEEAPSAVFGSVL